ncbi:response regulator [Actinoplanes sp. NPDC026619]|uniref:hybrid sensor histidine kinase/response regulator n=1 Tax=Actinoplanes sp. NPDC026619 TaxID=3155798 RepID=UPI00340A9A21
MAYPLRYALADLALALSRVAENSVEVRSTAARAAADMIGDGAGVQLLRDDGRYDTITYRHVDDERSASVGRVLDHVGQLPDDDFSTALAASRRPIVLAGDGVEPLAGDEHHIHAAVLVPVIVDNTYAGYLVLTRGTPGAHYSTAEVELARDIAGELALAVSSARALERLRMSEERYRRVLETIPEGVLQLDPDGVATYANEPMGVVLGMPRSQLVGVSLRGFLDDQGQKELTRRLGECEQGRSTVGATRLMRADGSRRSVRMSMMPLMNDQDQFSGVVCMVTDTTDHIDARGLKRQLDHLRRLDSLGQLIGGISHDFNNLLTVVGGSADMILTATEDGTDPHRLAQDILDAVGTGRTLTHQLLAFGRSDGNRPEIIPIPDLLTDVQSLFSRTLGEHIGLDLAFGADVWAVRAERGPLEQALVNVAANARDAMLHGGMLRVAATNEVVKEGGTPGGAPAGRVVHLVIQDTGTGMTDEVRRRALEPFFTTRPTASGLGLATTAGIVQGIGGHIELESEPRIGTTVHLYLPAAEEKPAPAAGRQNQVIGNVLIVEDQPEVGELVRRLIEPAGYTITVATDALMAVTQVAAGAHPDLLITDVVMPTMTGPELASALRTHHPDLPVLFMSGYTAASLGPQLHLDDNSMLIEKPFTRSTLLGAIRTLCGPQPAPGE